MYKVEGYSYKPGMMHKEKMKPKYDLEDYIYDVESRSLENEADPTDIYAQLQQKEKDLILAAELGKALLEKNEELSRHNERLAEEYSQKLEVISLNLLLLISSPISDHDDTDFRIELTSCATFPQFWSYFSISISPNFEKVSHRVFNG